MVSNHIIHKKTCSFLSLVSDPTTSSKRQKRKNKTATSGRHTTTTTKNIKQYSTFSRRFFIQSKISCQWVSLLSGLSAKTGTKIVITLDLKWEIFPCREPMICTALVTLLEARNLQELWVSCTSMHCVTLVLNCRMLRNIHGRSFYRSGVYAPLEQNDWFQLIFFLHAYTKLKYKFISRRTYSHF